MSLKYFLLFTLSFGLQAGGLWDMLPHFGDGANERLEQMVLERTNKKTTSQTDEFHSDLGLKSNSGRSASLGSTEYENDLEEARKRHEELEEEYHSGELFGIGKYLSSLNFNRIMVEKMLELIKYYSSLKIPRYSDRADSTEEPKTLADKNVQTPGMLTAPSKTSQQQEGGGREPAAPAGTKIIVLIESSNTQVVLYLDPKGVTQEDLENLMALWPHCFLKNSFEFFYGDGDNEVPIVYGRPLAEFGIEKNGERLVARDPRRQYNIMAGCVSVRQIDYTKMTRVGAWAEKSFAEGSVPPHRLVKIGLNMLCDCHDCGTKGVYVQMGLVQNVDVVLFQFGPDFRCPVHGCGKTPIFRELIFAAPADRDVRFTVHGHYMENGVPRIIDQNDARAAICEKNKWCRIDEAVVGGESQWIRLVVSAEASAESLLKGGQKQEGGGGAASSTSTQ